MRLVLVAAASLALFWGTAALAQPAPQEVCTPAAGNGFAETFEAPDIGTEWSPAKVSKYPNVADAFLGNYGNDAVQLRLRRTGSIVTVAFDLLIIQSWDGLGTEYGPDYWVAELVDGPVLLRAAFDSTAGIAALDTAHGTIRETGRDTLGYDFHGDATFRVELTFAPASEDFVIVFRGEGLQGLSDESWGIDNVNVAGAVPCRAGCDLSAAKVALALDPPARFAGFKTTVTVSATGLPECAQPVLTLVDRRAESEVELASFPDLAVPVTLDLPVDPGGYALVVSAAGQVILDWPLPLALVPGGSVELVDAPAYVGQPLTARATLPERGTSGLPWVGLFAAGSAEPLQRRDLPTIAPGRSEDVIFDAVAEAGAYELRLFLYDDPAAIVARGDAPVGRKRLDLAVRIDGPAKVQLSNQRTPLSYFWVSVTNRQGLGDFSSEPVKLAVALTNLDSDAVFDPEWHGWLEASGCSQDSELGISFTCSVGALEPGRATGFEFYVRAATPGRFKVETNLLHTDSDPINDVAALEVSVEPPRDAYFAAIIEPGLHAGDPPVATLPLGVRILSKGAEADRAEFLIFASHGVPADEVNPEFFCPQPFTAVDNDSLLRWADTFRHRQFLAACLTDELATDAEAAATFELSAPDGMLFVPPGTAVPAGVRTEKGEVRLVVKPATRTLDERLGIATPERFEYLVAEQWSALRLTELEKNSAQPGDVIVFSAQLANTGTAATGPFNLVLDAVYTPNDNDRFTTPGPIDFGHDDRLAHLAAEPNAAMPRTGVAKLSGALLECGVRNCRVDGLSAGELRTLTIEVPTGFAANGELRLAVGAGNDHGELLAQRKVAANLSISGPRVEFRLTADAKRAAHEPTVLTLDALNLGTAAVNTVVVRLAAQWEGKAGSALALVEEGLGTQCRGVGGAALFAECRIVSLQPDTSAVIRIPVASRGAGDVKVRYTTSLDPPFPRGHSRTVSLHFTALRGDVDDDGDRDCEDLRILIALVDRFKSLTAGEGHPADVDGSKEIDGQDILAFWQHYPNEPSCPPK